MKEQIIEAGLKQNISRETLENKYKEYYDFSFKTNGSEQEANEYAALNLRRFIKKCLYSNLKTINAVILGDSLTDWGEIMRRKNPDGVYPEGHFDAGKPIPEHDYDKTLILVNTEDNKLFQLKVKGDLIPKFDIAPGSVVDIKLEKGYKDDMYFINKDLTDVKVIKKLSYDEIKQLCKDKLSSYVVKLPDLFNTQNDLKIIKADVLTMKQSFNNLVLLLDGNDMPLDMLNKEITVKIDKDKVKFPENTSDVIFVCDIVKRPSEYSVEVRSLACFATESKVVKPKEFETKDIVSESGMI